MKSYYELMKAIGQINLTLLIVFIVLKLIGVIAWSWLWVLAPFWIPWSLFVFILAVAGVMLLAGVLVTWYESRKVNR